MRSVFRLTRLALQIAHVLFKSGLQIARGTLELRHDLAKISCKLRQLFRAKDNQSNQKNDYEMGHA